MAVGTDAWLLDLSEMNRDHLFSLTLDTHEVSLLHLRDNIAVADDDSTERDQLVDVAWAKLPHSVYLPEVLGAYLDDLVVLVQFIKLHVLIIFSSVLSTNLVDLQLLEDLCDHQIEDWNNI